MKFSLSIFSLIFLACSFFACKPDPEPEPDPDPQVFTCTINGNPFTGGVPFNNTLVHGVNSFSGMSAKRIDIRAMSETNDTMAILTFGAEPAFDSTVICPSTTNVYEEIEFAGRTTAFFSFQVGSLVTGFPVDGWVRVSACDEENERIDGTFELRTLNLQTGDTIEIKNGVFKNIKYRAIPL